MNESIVPLKISSIDLLTEHWIAEGERIATERIIKLLDTIEGHDAMIKAYEGEPEMKTLVALIKGEK